MSPLLNRRLKRSFSSAQAQSILLDAFWYAFLAIWNGNNGHSGNGGNHKDHSTTNNTTSNAAPTTLNSSHNNQTPPPKKRTGIFESTDMSSPSDADLEDRDDAAVAAADSPRTRTKRGHPAKTDNRQMECKTTVTEPPLLHINDYDAPTHKLFSRIAQNYVQMFIVTGPADKDGFIQVRS
ncbi:hypothetical protein HDV00_004566 [Rhizophlyctis rosea]|nr:hypothetical protein HDV00_004566 [Rhizophlyctis rosea]